MLCTFVITSKNTPTTAQSDTASGRVCPHTDEYMCPVYFSHPTGFFVCVYVCVVQAWRVCERGQVCEQEEREEGGERVRGESVSLRVCQSLVAVGRENTKKASSRAGALTCLWFSLRLIKHDAEMLRGRRHP